LPSATLAGADDTTLVKGLCEGDPRATREAWHRFGPMVHRLLLRTLGPEGDLEDLSQEVFITFFDRVKTLRDPRTVPVGLNLSIAVGLAFALQGLSVVKVFLVSHGMTPGLIALLFLFTTLTMWPILPLACAGVGLMDLWLDFRRLEPGAPEGGVSWK